MPRNEMYPWSELNKVGDFFIITKEFKPDPFTFMNATVAIRNKRLQGISRLSCSRTSYGCIVMLVQVGDKMPMTYKEVMPGVFTIALDGPTPTGRSQQPVDINLSYAERVARLPHSFKSKHLPWWWDNGRLLWNSMYKDKRIEDIDAYISKNFSSFGPDVHYPEFYGLNENLELIGKLFDETEDENDEFWGEDPVIDEGEGFTNDA